MKMRYVGPHGEVHTAFMSGAVRRLEVVEVPDHVAGNLGPNWEQVEATEPPELSYDAWKSEPDDGDEE